MDSRDHRGYREIEIVRGRRAFDESVKNRVLGVSYLEEDCDYILYE